jgi:hypothetical protein
MGLLGNGAGARILFDENKVPPFQAILENRIRRREAKSANHFGIFG